ncbi:hypothetical protein CLV99_4317 [Sphingobacterium yanglingense]|uniref:Uncharacterized protein n=1 Tax=Sphingobacterium yanglingense TaxID=1437280 RepID=A0A4R6W9K5_9SPHI|nr:hypothetical protein CLV99_4317 [Sphingobacterium yanglingense]
MNEFKNVSTYLVPVTFSYDLGNNLLYCQKKNISILIVSPKTIIYDRYQ